MLTTVTHLFFVKLFCTLVALSFKIIVFCFLLILRKEAFISMYTVQSISKDCSYKIGVKYGTKHELS